MNHQTTTKVYFDGLCHLCSREIEHYRRQRGSSSLAFVDITAPAFDAAAEGLDPVKAHRELHVRRPDQSLAVGVEAFMAIWEVLPSYRVLARVARLPAIKSLLRFAYLIFARVRPMLPRRKADCSASPLCDINHQKSNHTEGAKLP